MSSPDPRALRVEAQPVRGDPLAGSIRTGTPLGLLGIELETRRRNRLNATVRENDATGFTLSVDESFGNCPQYIQVRQHRWVAPPETRAAPEDFGARLPEGARALIDAADTFFIATASPEAEGAASVKGCDVSHRGGKPGFVRVTEEGGASVLTSPDFLGNFQFRTFGNLEINPLAGLLFLDFATGDMLFLTGTARVIWDGPEVAAFAGAERLLQFTLTEGRLLREALPLRWSAPEPSPYVAATGSWEAVAAAQAAQAEGQRYRPFRLMAIEAESETVRSFYLEPADGGGIAPHAPGQFLPIAVTVAGETLKRTYTLSHAANGRFYRVSIKRDGRVSSWLHDQMRVGDRLECLAPRGAFTLDLTSPRPVLLLAGGIGITPMLAMLDALLGPTDRTRVPNRKVYLVYAVRHGGEHGFKAALADYGARHQNFTLYTLYSAPRLEDTGYDGTGHVSAEGLQKLFPLDDYDAYLCGPPGFMQAAYGVLRRLGVADARIFAEVSARHSSRATRIASRRPQGRLRRPSRRPSFSPALGKPPSGVLGTGVCSILPKRRG
ncbi:FAD-binding oxidoreductase [Elstera litoralis]|uniref:FAD-binding oxidoreductase n=1 Tax=Elstera litoralis TaxID=552518 RepID=UPI000AC22785|nr:pyridoxamine 5'-phosphate oxidase family protein [Elstera litoralis]